MHFYWRVIEELKFMGETWMIRDPGLLRNYRRWLRSNSEAIAMTLKTDARPKPVMFDYKGICHSLN